MEKFLEAHEEDYETALNEIKQGYKQSHWMWYIFPQIVGLGKSYMAQAYAINNIDEAKEYLANKTLYNHYEEMLKALIDLDEQDIFKVFHDDYKKLRSSLTLFYYASDSYMQSLIQRVINKYYAGLFDDKTIEILNGQGTIEITY